MPRGPAGTTELSHPHRSPQSYRSNPRVNSRTLLAPAAAFTMACLLFIYTRTSIRAAKANAQRHRDADSGGQGLDLYNESRRRHGLGERVETKGTVSELATAGREQLLGSSRANKDASVQDERGSKVAEGLPSRGDEEEKLRAAMGRRSA